MSGVVVKACLLNKSVLGPGVTDLRFVIGENDPIWLGRTAIDLRVDFRNGTIGLVIFQRFKMYKLVVNTV